MWWYSLSREDFLDLLYKKYAMEEIENGCLWLWAKETDYKLTEWLLDALPTLYPQDEIIFEYNQAKQSWSKKSCTLFSPIWAISDLFNIEISLSTAEQRDTSSYNNGRMKDSGRYVALWVDHIVKEYNNSEYAKKYWKAAYYSVDLKDNSLIKKILDKRYTICTWYQWNAKYNNDKNKDWILNGTTFGASTYGHAVGAIWSTKYPARIKDNYKGTEHNIYEVEHEFSEIPCFYDKGYVITKVAEDNLERVKQLNEIRTKILNWKEINSELWHLSGSDYHKNKLHDMNDFYRDWLSYIENELKSLM